MAKLNKVYSFNTGRHYAENKQPIDWMIVNTPKEERTSPFYFPHYVYFTDRARGISGIIPCMVGNIEDLIHDSWVKNQYDSYQYRDNIEVMTIINEAMKNEHS